MPLFWNSTLNETRPMWFTRSSHQKPRIVGLGVYIWNVNPLTQVVIELKRDHPEITIVFGGPEVRFEADLPDICEFADYIVAGEADFVFPDLCRKILTGDKPPAKIIRGRAP